jgi:beta-glucosidase/6-phospho-beta-glucosidase/beta-galactosidase
MSVSFQAAGPRAPKLMPPPPLLHCSVGHHLILAHAHAARTYQKEFQPSQGGTIGITLNGDWAVPYDNSPESQCHR